MNKFYIQTLGCRLNQAESQELAQKLLTAGWHQVDDPTLADLMIINTCVVTHKAERETRQAIRRLRTANPKAKLVVAGCWVDKIRRFGGRRPEGIDYLVANREKWDNSKLIVKSEKLKVELRVNNLLNTRGLIWVQKGCSNQCTYCLTRLVRGSLISKPIDYVVAEVNQALKAGVKEVVLTGQNLSQYWEQGKDWINLVDRVLRETDVQLLRLGSINPSLVEPPLSHNYGDRLNYETVLGVARRLVAIYQGVGRERLARHLHLSLQSGSNRILKLMKRNYTVKQFAQVVDILRHGVEGINITTDIIVGFPGETEKDFQETLDFVQKIGFGKIHIFRYSSREGTSAAEMEQEWGKVDERVKKARAQRLTELERKLRFQFWQDQIGKTAKAIIWPDGRGLTDNYLPITKIKNQLSADSKVILIRLLAFNSSGFVGRLVKSDSSKMLRSQ